MSAIAELLSDLGVYLANGILIVAYLTAERLSQLIALSTALVVAGTFDRLIQNQATFAPRRYESGSVRPSEVPRTGQGGDGLAIGLWLAAPR
jgi:hypothetical protein